VRIDVGRDVVVVRVYKRQAAQRGEVRSKVGRPHPVAVDGEPDAARLERADLRVRERGACARARGQRGLTNARMNAQFSE
jgi:hypothetical protein